MNAETQTSGTLGTPTGPFTDTCWQWVDHKFGPMGWFCDEDKREYEGTAGFDNGYWRPVGQEERDAANRDIARLWYEQS